MINGVGVASTSINDEGSMGIKTCVYRIGNISDIRPKQPSVNLEKEREKNNIFCSVRQAINSSTTFRIPNFVGILCYVLYIYDISYKICFNPFESKTWLRFRYPN